MVFEYSRREVSIKNYFGWLTRPQTWAGLAMIAFLAIGVMNTWQYRTRLHIAEQRQAELIAEKHAALREKGRVAGATTQIKAIDCLANPCVALTFDDGPNPITTPLILDILEREQVHATFFVVGSRVAGNEHLLQRMVIDGDEIGNHSWSHPDFTKLTAPQMQQQIDQTQAVVSAAGAPAPILFRPPYGKINSAVIDTVPLAIMLWNEDPRDWAANTPVEVQTSTLSAIHPGSVVEMHDIYHVTVNALEPVIQSLKQQHYQLVTASQLLDIHPGQRGEFYGRP